MRGGEGLEKDKEEKEKNEEKDDTRAAGASHAIFRCMCICGCPECAWQVLSGTLLYPSILAKHRPTLTRTSLIFIFFLHPPPPPFRPSYLYFSILLVSPPLSIRFLGPDEHDCYYYFFFRFIICGTRQACISIEIFLSFDGVLSCDLDATLNP